MKITTVTSGVFGFWVFLLCTISVFTCSKYPLIAGAGSETTNSLVGKVIDTEGTPTVSTIVHLIPASFNSMHDSAHLQVMTDTTDSLGMYAFSKIPSGVYNLQALHVATGTRLFKGGIRLFGWDDTLPEEVLHNPASLEILFADHMEPPDGYVFVIGTLISDTIVGGLGHLLIDSVPAGLLPAVFFKTFEGETRDTSLLIADSVRVHPGDSTFLFSRGWAYSRKIFFNTTATGAGTAQAVTNFPVLVRLDKTNFSFDEAQSDGRDIRFAKSNNVPLAYEIVHWDSDNGEAQVWVRIDTVFANDTTRYMIMRWGNLYVPALSDPAGVFDTSSGFQGVWHMEPGSNSARDATSNRFNAISGGPQAPGIGRGAIGFASTFDGISQFYTVPGTASGKLNFHEVAPYTISAWVYVENSPQSTYTLVSKGLSQYSVYINNSLTWNFAYNFRSAKLFEVLTGPMAAQKEWKYITCVRGREEEYFYENGVLMANLGVLYKKPVPYSDEHNVSIGKDPALDSGYFCGRIDEVCIADVMRSPDWLRLSYMNQKNPDALLVFK